MNFKNIRSRHIAYVSKVESKQGARERTIGIKEHSPSFETKIAAITKKYSYKEIMH